MKKTLERKDFCCDDMFANLVGDKHGCEIYFRYSPDIRAYDIPYKPKFGGGFQKVCYCPWCGSRLPDDLNDKMMEVLKEEFNIGKYDRKIIPPEFRTDAWWKKRGL